MGLGLIAGAMQGAGDAGVAAGLQAQKQYGEQDLLKMRAAAEQELARTQATLAQQTHAANTETDIAAIPRRGAAETNVLAERADKVPQKLAAGESLVKDGKVTLTTPHVETDSMKAYHEALANRLNADAEAIKNNEKYRGKPPQLPKVSKETNPDGTQHYLLDSNSGAIGTITPGTPAKEAVNHWFSADEPAKAALPDVVQWSYNGKVLPGGLSDLYPEIRSRVGDAGGTATPGPAAPGAVRVSAPPQAAIDYLQKNPNTATDFDVKYGSGAAAKLIKPAAAKPAATPAAAPAGVVNKQVATSAPPAQGMEDFETRRASVLRRIESAKNDPQIKALEAQRTAALRQGKTVEANNLTAQIKKLTDSAK